MTHIICLSNLSVPAVLEICRKIDRFRIITDQSSIETFFVQLFSKEKVIRIPSPPKFPGIRNILKPILLTSYRQELMQLLGRPKKETIYFFYNAFGFNMSWWIKEVARDNEVLYKPDIDISMWKEKRNFRSEIKRTWIRMNFSAHTTSVWTGERFIYKVSDRFIRQHKIRLVTDFYVDQIELENFIREKFNLEKKKFLLLTGNTVPDEMVTETEFIAKNDQLIEQLDAKEIAVKVHPRFTTLFSREQECQMIPTYIPANVILPNFEFVIGYTSSVLFEAANLGIPAISLLNIFEPVTPERKEKYRKYLTDNLVAGSKEIHFPESIGELIHLTQRLN